MLPGDRVGEVQFSVLSVQFPHWEDMSSFMEWSTSFWREQAICISLPFSRSCVVYPLGSSGFLEIHAAQSPTAEKIHTHASVTRIEGYSWRLFIGKTVSARAMLSQTRTRTHTHTEERPHTPHEISDGSLAGDYVAGDKRQNENPPPVFSPL